jgi:hypothetical protein
VGDLKKGKNKEIYGEQRKVDLTCNLEAQIFSKQYNGWIMYSLVYKYNGLYLIISAD